MVSHNQGMRLTPRALCATSWPERAARPPDEHRGQAGGTLRSARFHLCLRQGAGKQFVWLEVGSVKVRCLIPPTSGYPLTGTGREPLARYYTIAGTSD
jgi:hypothetical protein